MQTISPTEPLDKYVRQFGLNPGQSKLDLLKRALTLRGTPSIRSQEPSADPVVYIKLFDPTGVWTFFVLEWDGKDTIFGFCVGMASEFGYGSLAEIANVPGPLGIGLEIDVWFLPQPLSKVIGPNLD